MKGRFGGATAIGLLAIAALVCGCGETRDGDDAAPADAEPLFEDVTARSGIDFVHQIADGHMDNMVESVGSGAVSFDYDGDGCQDLYLLQHAPLPNRLYRNRGDGTFEDATERAGVGDTGFGITAAVADYDNDGDADLFVFNDGPNRFYRNAGDGTFEEIADRAGVAGNGCTVGGTLLDADGDGLLDLYVANYILVDEAYRQHYPQDLANGPLAFEAEPDRLYLNNGDGTFRDGTAGMGLGEAFQHGRAMGVVAADFDGDRRADVFVANDASANFLLKNLGGGRFKDVAERSGLAYGAHGEATGTMAGSIGDFDNDGLPDMHVTDTRHGSLYHNRGKGNFIDRALGAGLASVSGQYVSWGGGFMDFDNDGDVDLYLANGDLHQHVGRPDLLLENVGGGKFVDASKRGGPHFQRALLSRGGCIGDFDNDGRLDILVTNLQGPPVLLAGRADRRRHWVLLDVRAVRGNRDALGAIVTLAAGGRQWVRQVYLPAGYVTQADPRLHFGLGRMDTIERVSVQWPSGGEETFEGLAVDRIHRLVEGKGTK